MHHRLRRLRESVSNWLVLHRPPSPLFAPDQRFLRRLRRRGYRARIIYDIGASTGVWSETMLRVFPEARCHLFEPLASHPVYAAELAERLTRLPGLILHPMALGEADAEETMAVAEDGFGSSLHDRGNLPLIRERLRVPVRRLDTYVRERSLEPPDIVKIDTQGFEAAILRGGAETIRHAGAVLVELWLERGYGPQTPLAEEIINLLKPLGFTLVDFGERFWDSSGRLYSVDAYFLRVELAKRFRG
jgi:FkbM family methyltransferase